MSPTMAEQVILLLVVVIIPIIMVILGKKAGAREQSNICYKCSVVIRGDFEVCPFCGKNFHQDNQKKTVEELTTTEGSSYGELSETYNCQKKCVRCGEIIENANLSFCPSCWHLLE